MSQISRTLMESGRMQLTILRLCHQMIEVHPRFENAVLVAIQPRGIFLGRRVHALLKNLPEAGEVPYGELDVTFHRDDFRRGGPLKANQTTIPFSVEGKKVILIDDVLYTGRTIRAAMDALLSYGRPEKVELLVMVDRRRMREVPVEASFTGIRVDTLDNERVIVRLEESGEPDVIRIEQRP